MLRITVNAFFLKPETEPVLQALRDHRKLMRSKVEVQGGGIDAATAFLGEGETPQLLIIETGDSNEALFEALDGLAGVCSPDTRVILMGPENDIGLYKRLIDMGISDYFAIGATTEQIAATIEAAFSDVDPASQARVIAFIGARGGAGSSVVAANTAYSLGQEFKEPVALVDLDIAFGTSALALNLDAKQTVADALAQPGRLDETLMERFMLGYDDYLSVVPAPATLAEKEEIRADSLELLLKLACQAASYVALDLPHIWRPWVHELLLRADEVVVTAHPDLAGLRDVKNLFDLLTPKRGIDAPTRLVFNQVGASKKTELSAKDFESAIDVAPTVKIPYEPALFGAAINNGEMVVQASRKHKVTQELKRLARVVSARNRATKRKGKSVLSLLKSSK